MEAFYDTQGLADYLGVPVATIYQWRHRQEGPPAIRLARGRLRFPKRAVETWLREQEAGERASA
jgi:excisionase family DNA binding protein